MRVTSALWVAAYIRRCFTAGASAVVMRKGAADAGAIFLVVDRLDGTSDFYAPAPQALFDESRPSDRLFECVAEAAAGLDIAERIQRETRFDPDVWIVAVEDRDGRAFLELD